MKKSDPETVLDWSEKIKRQLLSNKSARAWCLEHSVPYSTFCYWKKYFKKQADPQPTKTTFVELPQEPSDGWIEILLPGAKVTISKNFDRGALLFCLKLLGGH